MGEQARGDGGGEIYLLSKPLLFAYWALKYCGDTKLNKDAASSSRGYLVEPKLRLFYSHTRKFGPLKS